MPRRYGTATLVSPVRMQFGQVTIEDKSFHRRFFRSDRTHDQFRQFARLIINRDFELELRRVVDDGFRVAITSFVPLHPATLRFAEASPPTLAHPPPRCF